MATDYARLPLADIHSQLLQIADQVRAEFSGLDAAALNWRPDGDRWSVAQCLEHLLTTDDHMFQAAAGALDGSQERSTWHHVPLLPRVWAALLIRTQAPSGTRKFVAPSVSRPGTSEIAPDVLERFAEQHRRAAAFVATVNEARARRALMTSPFVRVIAYSVLDGWRLVVAHDRRHVEQARRVVASPGFPAVR